MKPYDQCLWLSAKLDDPIAGIRTLTANQQFAVQPGGFRGNQGRFGNQIEIASPSYRVTPGGPVKDIKGHKINRMIF